MPMTHGLADAYTYEVKPIHLKPVDCFDRWSIFLSPWKSFLARVMNAQVDLFFIPPWWDNDFACTASDDTELASLAPGSCLSKCEWCVSRKSLVKISPTEFHVQGRSLLRSSVVGRRRRIESIAWPQVGIIKEIDSLSCDDFKTRSNITWLHVSWMCAIIVQTYLLSVYINKYDLLVMQILIIILI